MQKFSIIVAMDEERGIGKDGQLPWGLSEDLKHFRAITTKSESHDKQNVVVMGRKTWDSIDQRYRPLADRINLVLTRDKNLTFPDGVLRAESFEEGFQMLDQKDIKQKLRHIFVIGGQEIFEKALTYSSCQRIFLTHIQKKFDCDTFFPPFEDQFKKCSASNELKARDVHYFFAEYQRKT